MKKKQILHILTIFLFIAAFLCCVHKPMRAEKISEGTDTVCEVSYSGNMGASLFLSEGDRAAVISPSGLPSREQTDAVIEGLAKWGFIPVEGKHVCEETRTLEDSIEDLMWALEDPSIKAVFCVRGGYGAAEIMDRMALDLIASAGKPIIGYSDISVYHSAWTSAGIPSIHASMSTAFTELPAECAEVEKNMISGNIPSYKCGNSFRSIEGEAEGILIGGNLSTFTSVLNTAYDCTKSGRPYILFLEEIGEDIRHIHRYLTVLKHHGVLDQAAGIIFGEWTDMSSSLSNTLVSSGGVKYSSVADMITGAFLEDADIPVAFGFPAGHGNVNYPLLMGTTVHLKVAGDSFTITWPDYDHR